ncbi:MAG: hypothetical protein AB8H86_29725 [Polyangiales bacterium]
MQERGEGRNAAECSDRGDNDGDGFVDCADNDCDAFCRNGPDASFDIGHVDTGPGSLDSGPGGLCENTCQYASDGECDDGGEGSQYDVCAYGSDCVDCGPRSEICTPFCGSARCGSDGCGGSCGVCAGSLSCVEGTCVDGCVPSCGARMCGADGCGGDCGRCEDGTRCTADGSCELPTFRALPAARAQMRLIDGFLVGDGGGHRVCLYGTDSDQPFLALDSRGTDYGINLAAATYIEVPAGIALRASVSFNVAAPTGTLGCDAADAVPLNLYADGSFLNADAFYTVVHAIDDSFAPTACIHSGASDCDFYPDTSPGSSTECAPEGLFVLEDGRVLGGAYRAGIRLTNYTDNASSIHLNRTAASGTGVPESSRSFPALQSGGYNIAPGGISVDRWRVCSVQLDCDPDFPEELARDPQAELRCQLEESDRFLYAEYDVPARLYREDLASTIYVFGNFGELRVENRDLGNSRIAIVVASDISDTGLEP